MATTWRCICSAFDSKKTQVLAFNATEAISKGYVFDVLLAIPSVEHGDVPQFLRNILDTADVTLEGSYKDPFGKHIVFNRTGIICEAVHAFNTHDKKSIFRILISPHTHDLQLSIHSRIFMNMPLPKLLEKVLITEDFIADENFKNKMQCTDYHNTGFTCQFNESSANFMARHMERLGAYSYIEESVANDNFNDGNIAHAGSPTATTKDILVLADMDTAVEALPGAHELHFGEKTQHAVITSFCHKKLRTATTLSLRDYNSEYMDIVTKTSKEDKADSTALVGKSKAIYYGERNIFGEVDISGENTLVQSDTNHAQKLADVAKNALRTQANLVYGQSTIPWLRAGYFVTISGKDYQIISVEHRCKLAHSDMEIHTINRASVTGFIPKNQVGYRNIFTCLPLDVGSYTSPCQTPRPHIGGCVHARIDGSDDAEYAIIDAKGRYRVKFFFPEKVLYADSNEPTAGRKSIPLRMLQAHTGQTSGIHFPLHVGADVLVAFMNGDPDRPFIMGSLSNPNNESVVTDQNNTNNMLKTPGGHSLIMDDNENGKHISLTSDAGSSIFINDKTGEEEIKLANPNSKNFIRLVAKVFESGAPDVQDEQDKK